MVVKNFLELNVASMMSDFINREYMYDRQSAEAEASFTNLKETFATRYQSFLLYVFLYAQPPQEKKDQRNQKKPKDHRLPA